MNIKRKIKQLGEKLDLSKRLNYKFNKVVFNISFFLMLIVVLMVWSQYDFEPITKVHYYVQCEDNICSNPLYNRCVKNDIGLRHIDCENIDPLFYEQEYLYEGQSLGNKPTWLMNNSVNLVFLILLLAIIVNHLLFNKDNVKRGVLKWKKK